MNVVLERSDFSPFFGAVNDGQSPFRWQERLLDHVLAGGVWPERVVAPTGSGKSSVVEVHIFANALAAAGAGPRVPRRMCVIVNRRGLVDHHFARAAKIADALRAAAAPTLLHKVWEQLESLRTAEQGQALLALNVRGGVPPNREWINDPSVCAVIAMTPEMWGSRLLFNGYGASRGSRPREAGLLALDSVAVLDESHLNRQLLTTARDASALVAIDAAAVGVPGLQVVEMSATPTAASSQTEIRLDGDDLERDPELRNRLASPKPVSVEATPGLSAKGATAEAVRHIVERARKLRRELPTAPDGLSNTVGIVVNRVDTAIRVAAALDKLEGPEHVACWVGRMRPIDVDRQRGERPGLFEIQGHQDTHYLVSTQTIEVGLDLDLAGMVTELAPGSAIAQRLGRVNRLGRRERAEAIVLVPEQGIVEDLPPYDSVELESAADWLHEVARRPEGAAPWALSTEPSLRPPASTLPRLLLNRLYRRDVELLLGTSEPPFVEPELAFHLRDDLEKDSPVASVVLRRGLPEDDSSAMSLLKVTPPDPREMFPVRLSLARRVMEAALLEGDDRPGRAFVWSANELRQAEPDATALSPGDTLIVDEFPFTLRGVVSDPTDPLVAAENDTRTLESVWGPPRVSVYFPGDDEMALFDDVDPAEVLEVARTLRSDESEVSTQIELPPTYAGEGEPDWVVVTTEELVSDDPDVRQEWSRAGQVSLEQHSDAVAARAARVSEAVGLQADLVQALRDAGQLHDRGKSDQRFQVHCLGRRPEDPVLAKSTRASVAAVRRDKGTAALPRGWRHEQLSAAMVMVEPDLMARYLVCRLVGTSHGWGRPFFPHGPDTLGCSLDPDVAAPVARAASDLFLAGAGWATVLDQTHRTYGAWGCAYLEALLRSADCMVSKEGS